jgi:hypothetical protein
MQRINKIKYLDIYEKSAIFSSFLSKGSHDATSLAEMSGLVEVGC